MNLSFPDGNPFSDGDSVMFINERGQRVEMPAQLYLDWQRHRIAQADQRLGIERSLIPSHFFHVPEHPDTDKFWNLASAIDRIPTSIPVRLKTQEANVWMRCMQSYWNAKAIALTYRIYPLSLPDPLADGGFVQKMLPSATVHNLRLEVDADASWYALIAAGEPHVRQWAEERGRPYPFATSEELFLETLRIGFEIYLTDGEAILSPTPTQWSRKQCRDHYHRWIKFLGDHFNGEPAEAEFESVLMTMGWKGYALSALRPLKAKQPFTRLWQRYLEAHRPLVHFQDTAIYWEDERPYQSDTSAAGKRTRRQREIQAQITSDGYFIWHWAKDK